MASQKTEVHAPHNTKSSTGQYQNAEAIHVLREGSELTTSSKGGTRINSVLWDQAGVGNQNIEREKELAEKT